MQRIFTEDVLNENGHVKFPAGMIRDFPRETWEGIELVSGKSLSEFTEIPLESQHAHTFMERTSGPKRTARPKLVRKETG